MATNIPSAMLTEVRGENRTHWVFELTVGSTILKYADHPVASESEGLYNSYIESWSDVVTDLGDDSYNLISPRTSVRIYDEKRVLQKLLAESAAGIFIGSTIEVWLRSFHVTAANHYRRFSAVVRNYRLVANRTFEIVYGPDDKHFSDRIKISEINRDEHRVAFGSGIGPEQIPDSSVGLPTQVIYGEHNSLGSSKTGALTAVPLATFDNLVNIQNYWFLSWGGLKKIPRIWANGVRKEQLTSVITINLTTPTLKSFTVVSADDADIPFNETVTFDCEGLSLLTPSSISPLITNPASILRHLITNFILQEWDGTSTWMLESTVPIDTILFNAAEDFFETHGIEGSAVFSSNDSGSNIISTFGTSLIMNIFWTTEFKIGVLIDDFAVRDTYLTESEHIRRDKGYFLSDLTMESAGDELTRDIIINSVFINGSAEITKRISMEKLINVKKLDIKVTKASLV